LWGPELWGPELCGPELGELGGLDGAVYSSWLNGWSEDADETEVLVSL
jgi:hypothetical protein